MPINLQTTFRGFSPPALANERIQKRVEKLEKLYPRVISCHVVAEEMHRHQQKAKLYSVHIDLSVPGGELVASKERHDRQGRGHEDFLMAIRDAFDALEARLRSYAGRQRGDVKTHEPEPHGRVTKLFPDYGFLESSDGLEIYFHANSVPDDKFTTLETGSEVRFTLAEKEGIKGPQASTVHPVGKQHPS